MADPFLESQATVGHFKDAILDSLAEQHNVAQFVSFAPARNLPIRFSRMVVDTPSTPHDAVDTLLRTSTEHSVNVRSFDPVEPKSREFIYGLTRTEEVLSALRRLAQNGLYTIVNETIDVHDGGVSGVAVDGLVEFAPDDTPRCVEKPGTVALGLSDAVDILNTVYRTSMAPRTLNKGERIEFSLHPLRRGIRNEHVIVWEAEEASGVDLHADTQWPNRFSRFLGDKTFGLLIAAVIDLPVPRTRVINRRVAPFEFGLPTGESEVWTRTAPPEAVPGFFTTVRGWADPLELWNETGANGERVAAILVQDAVAAQYSGALVSTEDGSVTLEGVAGAGDQFMLGTQAPEELPSSVVASVHNIFEVARDRLGPVRIEWAFDGERAWILQLHKGAVKSSGSVIYPGKATRFRPFDVAQGISDLRLLIEEVTGTDEGIVLIGNVGVTSHFGDVLRRARIPSRVDRSRAVGV